MSRPTRVQVRLEATIPTTTRPADMGADGSNALAAASASAPSCADPVRREPGAPDTPEVDQTTLDSLEVGCYVPWGGHRGVRLRCPAAAPSGGAEASCDGSAPTAAGSALGTRGTAGS